MQQLPKLSTDILDELRGSKNLLAYSAGSDSNALFFTLLAYDIEFDIALVNYKTREQSDKEEEYAKQLAKKFDKKCYTLTCKITNGNFESEARAKRYSFFEELIKKHSYQNLLSAHHLNDRFEWFLMQLSKGAGVVELSGMSKIEKRDNYKIIRPLLEVSKDEVEKFLKLNNIKYFIDSSNSDKSYFRNKIREEFASSFVKEHKEGIKKSFEYMQNDAKRLFSEPIFNKLELFVLKRDSDDLVNIRSIDRVLKKLGVLISSKERDEIIKTKDCVVARKFAISFTKDKIFIAPFLKASMDKDFKERCRVQKIPPKIRPYLFSEAIALEFIS